MIRYYLLLPYLDTLRTLVLRYLRCHRSSSEWANRKEDLDLSLEHHVIDRHPGYPAHQSSPWMTPWAGSPLLKDSYYWSMSSPFVPSPYSIVMPETSFTIYHWLPRPTIYLLSQCHFVGMFSLLNLIFRNIWFPLPLRSDRTEKALSTCYRARFAGHQFWWDSRSIQISHRLHFRFRPLVVQSAHASWSLSESVHDHNNCKHRLLPSNRILHTLS